MPQKVALLTAGGFAPCLSTAVGNLIELYTDRAPDIEIIAYKNGYQGMLTGDFIEVTDEVRRNCGLLAEFGGSPIGNSRVKLTNVKDLVRRNLVRPGENPLKVAADRLVEDGVTILHTIGGDDTNTTAADLAAYLAENEYGLTVVGLPKTVDNDIIPIRQSLGADTAAEFGARFARNVMAEHNAGTRVLVIHEVMGRHCGWLTAATARKYREWVESVRWLPEIGLSKEAWDVHAVYVPEAYIDLAEEADRLKQIMDLHGNANIFISEGAGISDIVAEMERREEEIPRDAFGHIRLEKINPGAWFGQQFATMLRAEKVLVQKSGYYSRSGPSNEYDLALIRSMCDLAVENALAGNAGVIGEDEENGDGLRVIAFDRIAGGKAFDVYQPWFVEMLRAIGQPDPVAVYDIESVDGVDVASETE
ncbi:MAG: pyrophosphate--fructose-6-phosphate 1-phosphotransferase [Propionibacteriaceae bacterium]|jgi:pyrophosphate--fructose-6-phosphate 1-phosphotransferase|nr:pyrophosphate--fructose-6-phosphate 1-phosphotransferase [Propionibacteriaceae bacterium]